MARLWSTGPVVDPQSPAPAPVPPSPPQGRSSPAPTRRPGPATRSASSPDPSAPRPSPDLVPRDQQPVPTLHLGRIDGTGPQRRRLRVPAPTADGASSWFVRTGHHSPSAECLITTVELNPHQDRAPPPPHPSRPNAAGECIVKEQPEQDGRRRHPAWAQRRNASIGQLPPGPRKQCWRLNHHHHDPRFVQSDKPRRPQIRLHRQRIVNILARQQARLTKPHQPVIRIATEHRWA